MLLRSVKYGINLGFGTVSVEPFGPTAFEYHINHVDVSFAPDAVTTGRCARAPSSVVGRRPRAAHAFRSRGRDHTRVCVRARVVVTVW
jgi:hypothetical protein